ncbi:restriction endonuclease [Acinetobacter soli]|uniref:restriction endonuclease n=1 Tax=Acinetobacter soli TaxID=487316 RepID=UPI00124F9689|nr:restriction endonuclease [Acinetobacter soli]
MSIQDIARISVEEFKNSDWIVPVDAIDLFLERVNSEYEIHKDKFKYVDDLSLYFYCLIGPEFLVRNDYFPKLALKKKQLQYVDEYGDLFLDENEWYIAVSKFVEPRISRIKDLIEKKIPKCWKTYEANVLGINGILSDEYFKVKMTLAIKTAIDFAVSDDEEEDYDDDTKFSSNDPYEYEMFISNKFMRLGWTACRTKSSGDQGADIIVDKANYRFVVQCKLYSSPVGNSAVQEITSAKEFYNAIGAVVVTNNTYTKSARQLAESQGVWLLHDSELERWNQIIENLFNEFNKN